MTIETQRDIDRLRRVGTIVAAVLNEMLDSLEPGMTTAELDGIGKTLLERYGVTSTCRASFGLYNTTAEVDKLADALARAETLFA